MANLNHKPTDASQDLDSSIRLQTADVPTSNDLQEDHDDTSSSGTSSNDEYLDATDEEDEEDEEDGTFPTKSKPLVPKPNVNIDLRSRLSSFLPQMERANKELEDAGDALNHRIDDVGEHEGRYIEMNLGLGVLSEEQDGNDIKFENSSTSDSDEDLSDKPSVSLRVSNNENVKKGGQHKIEEI